MPAKTSKPINPWAAMDALIKFVPEPQGAEWFTAKTFAERYHISQGQADRRLRVMLAQGLLEHWRGGAEASKNRITNKYRVNS